MPKPLKKIGQYDIIDTLYARKGYACYLATHSKEDRNVVIKAFDLALLDDVKAELKYARILKSINQPNLVRIEEVVRDIKLKLYYYVMECWGKDLRDVYTYKADQSVAIDIIKQVLDGLYELHRNKLVHRDIKFENIFIKDGVIKIGDYGLVKSKRFVTELTTIAGTHGYMAPEVLSGKPYDERCDIYSVGIVLLELLIGNRDVGAIHELPLHIKEVVQKATAKEPDKRFGSAEEFIEAFNRKDAEDAETDKTNKTHPLVTGKEKGAKTSSKPILLELDIPLTYEIKSPIPLKEGQWWKLPANTDFGVVINTLKAQFENAFKSGDDVKTLETGKELYNQLLSIASTDPNSVGQTLIKVNQVLAKLTYQKGNYKEAASLYQRCLRFDKNWPIPRVSDLVNLGNCYLKDNQLQLAFQYYPLASKIANDLPQKHQIQGCILNNTAAGYYLWNKYETAQGLFQQALRENETAYGKTHESIAINLYNLALTYSAMGNKSAAEPLYKQSLQIAEKTMKSDDERRKAIENTVNNLLKE